MWPSKRTRAGVARLLRLDRCRHTAALPCAAPATGQRADVCSQLSSRGQDHVPGTTPEMSTPVASAKVPDSATAPWQEPLDWPPLGPGTRLPKPDKVGTPWTKARK
ncbi:hypothetical protein HPB48_019278 [Haemaphysalis longicornis]|uniref:Uncharacterized protein n=1 Tax=Haemaphysalis longicornis TaxID=44386 RepID=A0A9J6FAG9_HAELO|nr:hypothetical protein HPB48_019278 [Haemaphysalis longicornis]